MKKKKGTSKIAISTISIASLITPSSCDSNYYIEENIQTNNDDIHSAVSICHTFTKEEIEYIHFIQELMEQIINKPDVAYLFATNPKEYMENHGYQSGDIFNKNAKHLKLITALGDPKVRQKLEDKDLKGFLTLCKEKGYAENYSGNLLEWITSLKSKENIQTNFISTRNNATQEEVQFAIPVVIWAAVVAAEWYYLLHVYKVGAWTETYGVSAMQTRTTDQTYINIALLTEDEKTAYILCDKYIEREIEIIVEAINKENPNLTEGQLLELTNFLKKNIIQLNDIITNKEK